MKVRDGETSIMQRDVKRKPEQQQLYWTRQTLKQSIARDEGHYRIISGKTQQEYITFVNISTSNMGTCQYIKQIIKNIKDLTDNNTINVGDGK